jgi:hypothetical protein
VTLFSSIFLFINTFPSPPSQPANQFSASLTYNTAGTQVLAVNILHLAGPAVPGSALVYITSSAKPTAFPSPFTVAAGTNNSVEWSLGQTWSQNITSYGITIPDNLTISVATNTQLLFRITLPGTNPNIPPTFTSVGTIPAAPNVGQTFQVYAQVTSSDLRTWSVYANLSTLPGITGSGLLKMTYSPTLGAYTYTVPTGTTQGAGTFYIFVNATSTTGLQNSVAFTVTIEASPTALTVALTANNTAPVSNTSVVLTALVANGGTSATGVTVTFSANAVAVGSAQVGSVGPGSTIGFSQTWTPTAPGVYLLTALANATGGSVAGGTLNLTVYPSILVIGHNVPAGVRTANNESAYLEEELTSDGIPFRTMWVACSAALPAATTLNGYNVVIVDFGSTWIGGCPKFPSSTEQAKFTGTTNVNFLVVGANAFGATTCSSYSTAYMSLLGVTGASSGTCSTLPNATGTLSYTSAPASGLRGDGIPGSMTINKTLGSSSSFVPYDWFTLGTTNTFLKVGSNPVGAWRSSGTTRGAAIAADPALVAATLPNGNNWGTGEGGASILFNVMNFLCRLSTATTTGHALTDFAIGQATLVGVSHAKLSQVYVALRANGPVGATVTATLYVSGSAALYAGTFVAATVTLSPNGAYQYVTLTWIAPSNGSFSLSVVLSSLTPDLYPVNNQLPLSVLNQATAFA